MKRRKPCPKPPKRPKVLPGDLYNCTLPFLGEKVAINHRDPARSIAGTVQGCRKNPNGRGSSVVVGKAFAIRTVKRALGLTKPRPRAARAETGMVLARPALEGVSPRVMDLPPYLRQPAARAPIHPMQDMTVGNVAVLDGRKLAKLLRLLGWEFVAVEGPRGGIAASMEIDGGWKAPGGKRSLKFFVDKLGRTTLERFVIRRETEKVGRRGNSFNAEVLIPEFRGRETAPNVHEGVAKLLAYLFANAPLHPSRPSNADIEAITHSMLGTTPASRPVLALPAPAPVAAPAPRRATAARRAGARKAPAREPVPVGEPQRLAPAAAARPALTTESFRNGLPRPVLGPALTCKTIDKAPRDCDQIVKAVRTIEPVLPTLAPRWHAARESVAAMRAWLEGRVTRAVAERSRFLRDEADRSAMWGTTEHKILSAAEALWQQPERAESLAKLVQARIMIESTPIDFERLYRDSGGESSWLTRENPTLSPPPWPSREVARAELVERLSEDPDGWRFTSTPKLDAGGSEMGVWRAVVSGEGPRLLEELQSKLLDWKVDWIRTLPVWRRKREKDPHADDIRKVESYMLETLRQIQYVVRFLAAEWTNPAEHAVARATEKRAVKLAPYVARWREAQARMEPTVRKTVAAILAWAPGARERFLAEAARTPELRVHEAKERAASAVAVFDHEITNLGRALAGETTREGRARDPRHREWDRLAETLNILDTIGGGRWRDWGYKRDRLTSGGGKYARPLEALAERVLVDPARVIVEEMVRAIGGPKAAEQVYVDSQLLWTIAEHEGNAWDWLDAWSEQRFKTADRPSHGMFRWVSSDSSHRSIS